MKAGITNAYVVTSDNSTVVLESTRPLGPTLRRRDPTTYEVLVAGDMIMAPDTIHAYDGLINTVRIEENLGRPSTLISLQHPSTCQVSRASGIPEKLILSFDRYSIKKILAEKLIVLDPGHGGTDGGKRGYINLLEKNVACEIAGFLKKTLVYHGAKPVMTRERDVVLTEEKRIQTAMMLEADMYLSIHTHWADDKEVHGAYGYYIGDAGRQLCEAILKELERKMRLSSLGMAEHCGEPYSRCLEYPIPWVWIEVCTISNPVEEGWLRSPVFKERVALALMNGVVDYSVKSSEVQLS